MSFITKRERVFNEYDLFDLPARNEGKLKTYASCTDARAWSHFCSDKTEHLVEIIKRNNETVRPKYVPTDVIVNTLMTVKNAEIARLRRKIDEFEQMIAAYDQLELTCEQKCEIANAHAAIKAANKELDEMCLDLDLSGYTEGVDSEAYEVEKFKEKEVEKEKEKEKEVFQACLLTAHDSRIDEMKELIINKDAKLSAMQNTIAVMENDVCEPYCIYAHIYTALEKIFGILCQNKKYKQYLDLLTAGKDTRCIDITGKILFKMKVLEKFSLALIAPCTQEHSAHEDCSCYRAEILTHVETTFALTSLENNKPNIDIDSKRAQLVADIMQHQEMQEILSKEDITSRNEDEQLDDPYNIDNYNIDAENINRLKNLQANYDDLLNCYETLKHERDNMFIQCQKYMNLEQECHCLQNQLQEYNQMWKEKEIFKKRSEDLDKLKENYYILTEETLNLETKLKAEQEINKIKCEAIDELRNENVRLEKKITEASLMFEKQKNNLVCKVKEYECKIMCQEQQIKSLSQQIDNFLEQEINKTPTPEETSRSLELLDNIEAQKEQIKNLKDAICCNEEEKQYLQEEYQKKLELINELKFDIEDLKGKYETAMQRNLYLEEYLQEFQDQISKLEDQNTQLNHDIDTKSKAIENLNTILSCKSQEVNNLMDEVDQKRNENKDLFNKIIDMEKNFSSSLTSLKNEKRVALSSIRLAKQESLEILKSIQFDDLQKQPSNTENNYDEVNSNIDIPTVTKESLDTENINENLLNEVQGLRDIHFESIQSLQDENRNIKRSLDVAKKSSIVLESKLKDFEEIKNKLHKLQEDNNKLIDENEGLKRDLDLKNDEIHGMLHVVELTKKNSDILIDQLQQSENIHDEFNKLNKAYHNLIGTKNVLEEKVFLKDRKIQELLKNISNLEEENNRKNLDLIKIKSIEKELIDLHDKYSELSEEKQKLLEDFDNKTSEMNSLYNNLEKVIEENQILNDNIKTLQFRETSAKSNLSALQNENETINNNFQALKKESAVLLEKIKFYEPLETELNELKRAYKQTIIEKEKLQQNLNEQLNDLHKLEQDNNQKEEILESVLMQARDKKDNYDEVKKEIALLKEEKQSQHKRIDDLLNKLEESDYLINTLNEDILARDKKITTLENHINELEDEIRNLHKDLEKVVETGEEIKHLSYEKLDQCLKTVEAHQSKATHNIKLELTKLQDEKSYLESQLSNTKLESEQSIQDKYKLIAQIEHLQNERLILISEIKQLELKSTGDSILTPSSKINDIVTSLNRISKSINNKNTSLEKTLLNVQASYQLLKTKANEAKILAEKERQKILDEKEEAKAARTRLEQQVEYFENKLKEEEVNHENMIRDLEREMLNQTLISDKMKQSKEDEILKLKNEISILQKKIKESNENNENEKIKYADIINGLELTVQEKIDKCHLLEDNLKKFNNKQMSDFGNQTNLLDKKINLEEKSTQTNFSNSKATQNDIGFSFHGNKAHKYTMYKLPDPSVNVNDRSDNNNMKSDSISTPRHLNEVQIMSAAVEPNIDVVKDIYINFKIKRLGTSKVEQCSINLSRENKTQIDNQETISLSNELLRHYAPEITPGYKPLIPQNNNIVSIYNTTLKAPSPIETKSHNKTFWNSKSLTGSNENINIDHIDESVNKDNEVRETSPVIDSQTDKDFFVIYTDTESVYDYQSGNKNESPQSCNLPFDNETATSIEPLSIALAERKDFRRKSNLIPKYEYEDRDDDSIKPRLHIKMPRVMGGSPSTITSIADKRSLDSYTKGIYLSPTRAVYSDTNISSSNSNNIHQDLLTVKSRLKDVILNKTSTSPVLNGHGEKQINNKKKTDRNTKQRYEKKPELSEEESHHNLIRNNGEVLSKTLNNHLHRHGNDFNVESNKGLQYILNAVQNEFQSNNLEQYNNSRALPKSYSDQQIYNSNCVSPAKQLSSNLSSIEYRTMSTFSPKLFKSVRDYGTLAKLSTVEDYENKIQQLTKTLENIEKDYKKKIDAVKMQYDCNVKSIINEHNQGVASIQSLHEETLHDIVKIHENEIENLRSMSIEAMRKAEKLEKENQSLKMKLKLQYPEKVDEEPKMLSHEGKRKKNKARIEERLLTKTNIEAYNVRPKRRSHGPCTCSLDMNISDTIRNIFEQVDVEQRKNAEQTYLRYIANKILGANVESLDAQELSFLHLKVCHTWKMKLNKEEAIQKKIDSLENELINKQRQTQKHMAELDRKVAEEYRRLQEVREAVCKTPPETRDDSPMEESIQRPCTTRKEMCNCNSVSCNITLGTRRSAGDLQPQMSRPGLKLKRTKMESNRAVLAKLDADDERDKKLLNDETPTRLKRSHDRQHFRIYRKREM
ncbi:unnamed protein product [Danaus chrysippus]|uniref:(African queen) hypothetical protein n=1 Tax=Danaus chrysippus TaxID=151541 RepID=A0A8J2W4Q4_9NEOP|nr:unnamed protein product [Danaus chrysippus]